MKKKVSKQVLDLAARTRNNIREELEQLGIPLAGLSKRMNMNPSNLSHQILGTTPVSPSLLKALQDEGVDLSKIIGGKGGKWEREYMIDRTRQLFGHESVVEEHQAVTIRIPEGWSAATFREGLALHRMDAGATETNTDFAMAAIQKYIEEMKGKKDE